MDGFATEEARVTWQDQAFIILGVAALVLELRGVMRRQKNDTISEEVWWLRKHAPAVFAVFMVGLLVLDVWLPFHFTIGGH